MIKTLLTDLGGVLMTNGWDYHARQRAAEHFKIDFLEFEKRHQLIDGVYEEGRMNLESYLGFAVFHVDRPFTHAQFYHFMKEQSKPHTDMFNLYKSVRRINGIPIYAVSNEGRDLAEYRVQEFGLKSFIDGFIVSAFVGARKPDPAIFKITLDIAQVAPDEVLFVDDREMLAEAADKAGIPSLWHQTTEQTAKEFEKRGLKVI